ncbi:MAG: sensor histidine kinase [Candidatus Cryptobacteroides sp.]
MGHTELIIICLAVASVAAVLTAIITTRAFLKKTSYMLDALEDGETNFRFSEKKLRMRSTNRILNRLKSIFEKEKDRIREQDAYLAGMMENISTAIIVLGEDGVVKYCNSPFLKMMNIHAISNIRQLSAIAPDFVHALLTACKNGESRSEIENELGKAEYSIRRSNASLSGKEVNILSINDISKEIDENEQKSWEKLIRVLTHEIMNTVSPIVSLSEAMEQNEENPARREGLRTIENSSKELIKFVQTYRDLTGLSKPIKTAFRLKDLVGNVIRLTEEQFRNAGAVCTYTEYAEDILIYGDESQISRIFINLLKNALQAGAHTVGIEADIDGQDRVCINISNDGRPIPEGSRDNIFVPFFSTKEDGSGIGLSLSRQIMRMHGGSLSLRSSTSEATVFSIIFR